MKRKRENKELLNDYYMLENMSKSLYEHQKKVKEIAKKVAKRTKTDLKYGLVEDLNLVLKHMENAKKELDKADKVLEHI